jgi:tripartite-type tricarboxylate transporter receptor subunit TctC
MFHSSEPSSRVPSTTRRLAVAGILLAAGTVCGAFAQPAQPAAQGRTLKLISGSIAGTSTDIIARLISQKLGERLGVSVIVENRAGAGGLIAAESVAKGAPDGSSLLITGSNHSTSAAMRKTSPFDPVNDFAWVSTVTTYPMILATAPNSRFKSLDELIAFAKANPRKVSFSSVGVGTAHHLIGEWLNAALEMEMVHVPYRGSPLALLDVLGGSVDLMIDTATYVVPQVRQGKLKPLAVSSKAAMEELPGVATLNKYVPGMEYESWIGLAAPRGMPAELVRQYNAEVRYVIELPEIKQRFVDLGAVAKPSTTGEFRSLVERDLVQWRRVIESRNISVQ